MAVFFSSSLTIARNSSIFFIIHSLLMFLSFLQMPIVTRVE